MPEPGLSEPELERHAHRLALHGWGPGTQSALRDASVLVLGAGAVGCPVALQLAAAGVGRLGVADDATVALAGLGDECLHFTPDLGVAKAASAAAKLRFLNPGIVVEPYQVRVEAGNVEALLAGQDVIVECSGSADTRALVNAACCAAGMPLVIGAAGAAEGLALTVLAGRGPCWRCAFSEPPAPEGSGLLGPLAAMLGAALSLEALRLACGAPPVLAGCLLRVDPAALTTALVRVARRADCPACGASL